MGVPFPGGERARGAQRPPCLHAPAEEAELRRVCSHDLRHTFASLLLQHGESVVYVREQLEHSSIQITVDTYGPQIPGANRAAVDRLDDASAHESAAQALPGARIEVD